MNISRVKHLNKGHFGTGHYEEGALFTQTSLLLCFEGCSPECRASHPSSGLCYYSHDGPEMCCNVFDNGRCVPECYPTRNYLGVDPITFECGK